MSETPTALFSREEIAARIAEVGAEIAKVYAGQELCVVGLGKGCLVFMSDLIRAIPVPITCQFLQSSSVGELGAPGSQTDIVYSADSAYQGQHVLLLDDVIDTGITLRFLLDHIREHSPASLRLCTLIDKPQVRKVDVQPDWAIFTLKEPLERFIVGYGLDYRERYRELPHLATISAAPPVAEARRIRLTRNAGPEGQEEA
jgi:hypoxanthine phosphoribosyltransferase